METTVESRHAEFMARIKKAENVFAFDEEAIRQLRKELGRVVLVRYKKLFWEVTMSSSGGHMIFNLYKNNPRIVGAFEERHSEPEQTCPVKAKPVLVRFYTKVYTDSEGHKSLEYHMKYESFIDTEFMRRYCLTNFYHGAIPIKFIESKTIWEDETSKKGRKSSQYMMVLDDGSVEYDIPRSSPTPYSRTVKVNPRTVLLVSKYRNEGTGAFAKAAFTADESLMERYRQLIINFLKDWENYK